MKKSVKILFLIGFVAGVLALALLFLFPLLMQGQAFYDLSRFSFGSLLNAFKALFRFSKMTAVGIAYWLLTLAAFALFLATLGHALYRHDKGLGLSSALVFLGGALFLFLLLLEFNPNYYSSYSSSFWHLASGSADESAAYGWFHQAMNAFRDRKLNAFWTIACMMEVLLTLGSGGCFFAAGILSLLRQKKEKPTPAPRQETEVPTPQEKPDDIHQIVVAAIEEVLAKPETQQRVVGMINPNLPPHEKIVRIPFQTRMRNASDEMKANYNALKSEIMSYGVHSRISNKGDTFRLHAVTFVRIAVAGKGLKLYLALDPADYKDSTIPFQDVGDQRVYKDVPFAFRVKSELSLRRAKDLIADVMQNHGLEPSRVEWKDWVAEIPEVGAEEDGDED